MTTLQVNGQNMDASDAAFPGMIAGTMAAAAATIKAHAGLSERPKIGHRPRSLQ